MSKAKEQLLSVKVNPAPEGSSLKDEVFITSKIDKEGNPIGDYVNRTVYAKPGLFKDGELSSDAVAKLEARSNKELADELRDTLAREAKEREVKESQSAKKEEAE